MKRISDLTLQEFLQEVRQAIRIEIKEEFDLYFSTIKEEAASSETGLLNTKQASKYLRCSTVTFWKIQKENNIEAVWVGKKKYFKKTTLDEYLGLNTNRLYTTGDLVSKFGINKSRLLGWQTDGKVKGVIVKDELRYPIIDVLKTMQSEAIN